MKYFEASAGACGCWILAVEIPLWILEYKCLCQVYKWPSVLWENTYGFHFNVCVTTI